MTHVKSVELRFVIPQNGLGGRCCEIRKARTAFYRAALHLSQRLFRRSPQFSAVAAWLRAGASERQRWQAMKGAKL